MADDEIVLIQRAQRGDHGAFGRLALAYEGVLFNLALRMVKDREDARDLTQETFLKAYRGLSGFDTRYRFFSWLYRIMMNECLNFLKARRSYARIDERMPGSDPSPEEHASGREIERMIESALMELRVELREVIVLRHFLQLSYAEMSDVLHMPAKTIKSRLYSARRQLGDILHRKGVTVRTARSSS
jgi:RNA polymerase sigma-70 factor (ECF subfamily)